MHHSLDKVLKRMRGLEVLLPSQSLGEFANEVATFLTGIGQTFGGQISAAAVIEHDLFGIHQFFAGVGDFGGDFNWNGRDAVEVAVQQHPWVDANSPDGDWHVDVRYVAVAVRANGPVGEDGKANGLNLIQVASCA